MTLSSQVIDQILESGLYFDDDFDFERKEIVLTTESRLWFKDNLGIKKLDSAFVDFYSFGVGGCGPNPQADCLFTLEEILENKQKSFYDKYALVGTRYLQLSSIEGEHSYFYDTDTDYLYGIDWSEIEDFFLRGKKKSPLFFSFNDFLEWYYSVRK